MRQQHDPSQPLRNARHEAFAREWAKDGQTLTQCARAAGYAKQIARKSGSRLGTNGDISTRRNWLRMQASRAAGMELEEGIEIAASIARDKEQPAHGRIAALKLIGEWRKWETGTQAANKAAELLPALIRRAGR